MVRKKYLLGLIILVIGAYFFWRIDSSKPTPIPIAFSKNYFPLVTVNIGQKEYPFRLTLTSKYPLFSSTAILKEGGAWKKGEANWKDMKGESYHAPLFAIPSLRVGTLTIKDMLAAVEDSEDAASYYGSFAWPFGKRNLLLDFPRRQIFGISKEKELKAIGYDIKKMVKTKCTIDRKGIFFKAQTSLGEIDVCLSTGVNFNVVNNLFWKKKESLSTFLKIGERNLGTITFSPFEITQELPMQCMLSANFLKSHVVYIDAKNRWLYIGDEHSNALSKSSSSKIPISFTTTNIPVVDIKVGKKLLQAKIDTGSAFELAVPFISLSKADLRYLFSSTRMNAIGEREEAECYFLPEYRVGDALVKNVLLFNTAIKKVKTDIYMNSCGEISSENLAYIGRPLLHRTNIYFDFPNRGMYLLDRKKSIPVNMDQFEEIPFACSKCGIIVTIQTDLGPFRFILDTGASKSVIKGDLLPDGVCAFDSERNNCFFSSTFTLGSHNYGEQILYPFPIAPEFGAIDGVLGMDFLRKHAFYIDFPKGMLYVQKN